MGRQSCCGCWFVGLLSLVALGIALIGADPTCEFHEVNVVLLSGNQSTSAGLTADDVRKHVLAKVKWTDPKKTWWSCVDGRSTEPGLTTPAGDSGEFILGLAVYEERLLAVMPRVGYLTQEDVSHLLTEFIATIPYSRRFYIHTDEHAVERLREAVGDENFDPSRRPPPEQQERLLELLVDPAYVGCGHLRLLLQHPEQYLVRPELTQWFLKAYFDFMWNHEHGGKLHHHTSTSFVELEGDHQEQAVVVINTDKSRLARGDVCLGLAPMVPGKVDKLNSFFTDYASFVSLGVRGEIANFFVTQLQERSIAASASSNVITADSGVPPGKNYAQLLGRMSELGDIQLKLTVEYLAKGEPQYAAMLVVARERKLGMIIGSIVSLVVWVLGLVAMILYGWKTHRHEEDQEHAAAQRRKKSILPV